MGVETNVLIFITVMSTICGLWMIAYVFYPRFSEWHEKNLGERLTKRMKWLDERDEELRLKKVAKRKRKDERERQRLEQVALGIIADEQAARDRKNAAKDGWGDLLNKPATEEMKGEYDLSGMDLEEEMRKHLCAVDGTKYQPPIEYVEVPPPRLRPKSAGAALSVSPHRKKKKVGVAPNERQETSAEAMTISQMAKERIRQLEVDKHKAFIERMQKVMTEDELVERGRKRFRHQLKHGSMGYQMPLLEHLHPTFGDLQDRIQWMRHSPFLHKFSLTDRQGKRTAKSFTNYIDKMDSQSALSLQTPAFVKDPEADEPEAEQAKFRATYDITLRGDANV